MSRWRISSRKRSFSSGRGRSGSTINPRAIGARIQTGPNIDDVSGFLCAIVQNADIPSKKQACEVFDQIFDPLPSSDPELQERIQAAGYDPALLAPMPRADSRRQLGVEGPLSFVGEDLWNAYEFSWLAATGMPQVGLLQITADAASPRMVESKSMKLYLNGFAQTRFPSSDDVEDTLQQDLDREQAQPGGSQFDGERKTVESPASNRRCSLSYCCCADARAVAAARPGAPPGRGPRPRLDGLLQPAQAFDGGKEYEEQRRGRRALFHVGRAAIGVDRRKADLSRQVLQRGDR